MACPRAHHVPVRLSSGPTNRLVSNQSIANWPDRLTLKPFYPYQTTLLEIHFTPIGVKLAISILPQYQFFQP